MFDLKWAIATFPALKDAQGKLDAKRSELATIFDQAGPDLDASKVKAVALGDGAAFRDEVSKRNDELDELKKEVDSLIGVAQAAYNAKHGWDGAASEQGDGGTDVLAKVPRISLGDAFVRSDAFKGYRAGMGAGPVGTMELDIRATLFERTAGWDPEETRTGRVELFATRPAPMVVDAIPQVPTRQAAVKYMEETTFTNNAAEAAEGAAYGEAALVLTERSVTVEKIAVWLPVTDEQLEDEDEARAYVNNRLPFMLRQRLDLQCLQGNGATPNIRGTENVVGIQTQALGGDPVFDAYFKLFRKIRDDGFAEPSVFFVTPANWQDVALTRTADGIYILGNPQDEAPTRMWGIPGIQTTAAPATKAIAGDYRNFSELRVRRGIDIQVTNAHSDFFVKGKLAIRCDVRVALVHYRPKAFGEVTGL